MGKRVIVTIQLVPESKDVSDIQIEEDIKKSLQCDWLAHIHKVTIP